MSESFNPSAVSIRSAIIKSYDGKEQRDISSNFITGFEINQSMSSVAYSGWISVQDSVGILEELPIRGEETLELKLLGHDLNTEVNLKTHIHKVTDIEPSQASDGVHYKLHFISKVSFEASKRYVTTAFRSSVNNIAKELFERYFAKLGQAAYTDPDKQSRVLPMATARYPIISEPERKVFIQPTVGILNVVIPYLNPTEAMFFVASRAFNGDAPSQTYRFFETLENFYFCTDEYFLKDIKDDQLVNLFYAPVSDLTPQNATQQLQRIESLKIISRGIDTSTDIFSGSYRNEVLELDLIRRKTELKSFNFDNAGYIDMTGNKRDISTNPHTEQFRKDTFTSENARRFMLVRNYTRPGDTPTTLNADLHFADIVQNRISYYHHLNNVIVQAGMKGRLDIRPGQIVNLEIKGFSSSDKQTMNNVVSGRYLVQSTFHGRGTDDTLNTGLTLVKFDWSARAGERIPSTSEASR